MIRARGAMASEKSGAWFLVRGGPRHEDGKRAQSDVVRGLQFAGEFTPGLMAPHWIFG